MGHDGHPQKFYSVEQCETVEDHYPERCLKCGVRLEGTDPEPYRVQHIGIPVVAPVVREHRFHALSCACCGSATRAWDDGIIKGSRAALGSERTSAAFISFAAAIVERINQSSGAIAASLASDADEPTSLASGSDAVGSDPEWLRAAQWANCSN